LCLIEATFKNCCFTCFDRSHKLFLKENFYFKKIFQLFCKFLYLLVYLILRAI
jgi:hypothetical protein